MERGLKALVIALVMALVAVPAAFAGHGNGGGHGKPSWAGQGKPSWAGSGHANGKAHHEQQEKKAKKPKHHEGDGARWKRLGACRRGQRPAKQRANDEHMTAKSGPQPPHCSLHPFCRPHVVSGLEPE